MTIDVVYLAFNRLEFTKQSFDLLIANTDWALVDRLIVYDDGSTDGTREWLAERLARVDEIPADFRLTGYGSPPAIMNDYVLGSRAELFAKVDNDIAMPSGWLNAAVAVMDSEPDLELLGLAAGWTAVKNGQPGYRPAPHIGGVGLMRVASFRTRPPIAAEGRQGFTIWQERQNPVRGWILPDVAAVQLDLIPDEPYRSLARDYVAKGWAREWPPMRDPNLWEWMLA